MHAYRGPRRRLHRRRALLSAAAVTAIAYCVIALISRALPVWGLLSLFVAVSAAYIPLLAVAGVLLAVLSRRIVLSIAAVLVLTATLAVQVPWYFVARPVDVGPHTDVRVLSSNLRKGRAEASSFVRFATQNADVIAVSELTPDAAQRFSRAGLEKTFRYFLLYPVPGTGGIGLWSRYPIVDAIPAKRRYPGFITARLQIPGVRLNPLITSLHITSPLTRWGLAFNEWQIGISGAKARLDALAKAAGSAAVIVAGDFNSTPDMRQFRDLLTNGYRDAVEQTGGGFGPTFPSRSWHPPVITIDHVLTRQAAASAIRTVYIRGSDHRAVLATVQVPLDPGP